MDIKVISETDDELRLSCGCVICKIGENLFISPCSRSCEVLEFVLKESRKQGNKISHHYDKYW